MPPGQVNSAGLDEGSGPEKGGAEARGAQGFSVQARCFRGLRGDSGISELAFPSHRIYLPIHRFRLEVVLCRAENVRVKIYGTIWAIVYNLARGRHATGN